MGLTGAHITRMVRAAGASPTGLVASPNKIADMFTESILKYGDGKFTTATQVAALLSECMVESAWFRTTEEYAKNGPYAPYIGRGFIQCTWRSNYAAFGKWCRAKKMLTDADYFVDHPSRLADLKWAAHTGVWYFTHVRFHGRPLVDYADNIRQVGKAVNLGDPYSPYSPNGDDARVRAYNAVRSVGNDIVPQPPPDQVADRVGTDEKVVTVKVPIHPTKGRIHTPYKKWGPWWSWNRRNGQGQHGGDDWHDGPSSQGNPIVAVANGRVIHQGHARSDSPGWGPAFGDHVLIEWDDHRSRGVKRVSIDAHMTRNTVDYNQRVHAGDTIGYLGATGNVTGPHDHHEQHAGQGWGDRKLRPIYPGKTITKIVEEGPEMRYRKKWRTKNQRVGRRWTYLRLTNKGAISWIAKPAKITGGRVYLAIGGLGPNESLYLYPGAYDVKKGKGAKQRSNDSNIPFKVDGAHRGWVRVALPWDWRMGDEGKGWGYRALRFRVRTNAKKPVTIARCEVTGWLID